MTGLVNFIFQRVETINYASPLAFLDLFLAILLVVGFFYYIRQFPIFRVLIGVVFLLFCAVLFFQIGFIFTALVFGVASNLILISLPLIFAPEIRHYLEKLGRLPFLKIPKLTQAQKRAAFIQVLVSAVFDMAERKRGGTVVIQRRTGLGRTIETGVETDAKFSSELLRTIFFPKTALHDGAVVIKNERIVAAGCLLPIEGDVKLGPPFGTRHRSGLTITRDTDAVVLIISEQRGQVSLAENMKLDVNLDREKLTERLLKLL